MARIALLLLAPLETFRSLARPLRKLGLGGKAELELELELESEPELVSLPPAADGTTAATGTPCVAEPMTCASVMAPSCNAVVLASEYVSLAREWRCSCGPNSVRAYCSRSNRNLSWPKLTSTGVEHARFSSSFTHARRPSFSTSASGTSMSYSSHMAPFRVTHMVPSRRFHKKPTMLRGHKASLPVPPRTSCPLTYTLPSAAMPYTPLCLPMQPPPPALFSLTATVVVVVTPMASRLLTGPRSFSNCSSKYTIGNCAGKLAFEYSHVANSSSCIRETQPRIVVAQPVGRLTQCGKRDMSEPGSANSQCCRASFTLRTSAANSVLLCNAAAFASLAVGCATVWKISLTTGCTAIRSALAGSCANAVSDRCASVRKYICHAPPSNGNDISCVRLFTIAALIDTPHDANAIYHNCRHHHHYHRCRGVNRLITKTNVCVRACVSVPLV